MTTKDKQDAARDIALITFQSGAQRLPSEEEISTYAQMLATISIKLIHGLEGQKLSDLNDHLFSQLERLGDESLTKEDLEKEIDRAKAISGIAKDIVSNASLVLKAEHMRHEGMIASQNTPKLLGIGNG